MTVVPGGALTVTVLLMDAHAARHGMGDFPVIWVGKTIKVSRRALLQWLDDVAVSHRDLTKASAMVESVKQMSEARGRGRPRKRREAVA